jgi:hypothetical protein
VYDKQGGLLLNLGSVQQQKMKGFDAADILEHELQKSESNDFSTNLSLNVEQPVLIFDRVQNVTLGETFPIRGRTNLAVGDELETFVGSSE